MTRQQLGLPHGTLAYEIDGQGALVVLAHGMGDNRSSYRFLAPRLVEHGYRVATVDLRGCGESSTGWPSHSRIDIANDLLALVRALGGPAVLVGHSISGGAVTIAASLAPELVRGLVEISPFTRKQSITLTDVRARAYRQAMTRLALTMLTGDPRRWLAYLEVAYPGTKPRDWEAQRDRIAEELADPGRMAALRAMGRTTPADAGEHLGSVTCPALIIEGSQDPDWGDPVAEGEAVVAAMSQVQATLEIVEGAGHYPHTQFPEATMHAMAPFLQGIAGA